MCQEILKFTETSGGKNGVGINMKASFQSVTVNVRMWLLSLTVAKKKCKEIGKHIKILFDIL